MAKGWRRNQDLTAAAIGLCLSTLLSAEAAWSQRIQSWTCTLPGSGETRQLDLVYETAGPVPCLGYDKQPTGTKIIADYSETVGQCERHVAAVLEALKRAGYDCVGPSKSQGPMIVEQPAVRQPGDLSLQPTR